MLLACYHCSTSLVMAGSMPAAHVWHKIIAVWAGLQVVIAVGYHGLSSSKSWQLRLLSVLCAVPIGAFCAFTVDTVLYGLLGPGFGKVLLPAVALGWLVACLCRRSLKLNPLAVLANLLLVAALGYTHADYTKQQQRDGSLLFALRLGPSPYGLKSELETLPLEGYVKLLESWDRLPPDAQKMVEGVMVNQTWDRIDAMDTVQIQQLIKGTKVPFFRTRLQQTVDQRARNAALRAQEEAEQAQLAARRAQAAERRAQAAKRRAERRARALER